MPLYRIGTNKAGVNAANTVMWQLRNPASRRTRVLEVGIFCDVAATTPPTFRLTRSLTLGATPTTAVLQPTDPESDAAWTTLDTAWGTAPTFTTAGPFITAWPALTAVGAGMVYAYDDLWVVAGTGATSGLQVVNLAATGATLGSFVLHLKLDE